MLRVRSGPGTSYERVASLRNGTEVTVVAEAGDGWLEITFQDGGRTLTGYVLGQYIAYR